MICMHFLGSSIPPPTPLFRFYTPSCRTLYCQKPPTLEPILVGLFQCCRQSVKDRPPEVFYKNRLLKPYVFFDVSEGRDIRAAQGLNSGSRRNQASIYFLLHSFPTVFVFLRLFGLHILQFLFCHFFFKLILWSLPLLWGLQNSQIWQKSSSRYQDYVGYCFPCLICQIY